VRVWAHLFFYISSGIVPTLICKSIHCTHLCYGISLSKAS
jgi:hypothetical protein